MAPRSLSRPSEVASEIWLARSTPAAGSSRKNSSGSPGRAPRSARAAAGRRTGVGDAVAATTGQADHVQRVGRWPPGPHARSGRNTLRWVSRPDATTSQTEAGTPDAAPPHRGRSRSATTRGTVPSAYRRASAGRRPAAGGRSARVPEGMHLREALIEELLRFRVGGRDRPNAPSPMSGKKFRREASGRARSGGGAQLSPFCGRRQRPPRPAQEPAGKRVGKLHRRSLQLNERLEFPS